MANTPNLDLENVNVLLDTDSAYNQLVTEIIPKINSNNLKIDGLPNNFIPSSQKGVANGIATLGNDGIIPKAQLPTDSGSVERVADITARDAITNLYDNKLVFVIDASDDTTVTAGWAMYIYSTASLSWTKIVDAESLDLQLTWDNITNKPTAFPPDTHTHEQIQTNADNITNLQNNKVDKITGSRLVSETEITVFNDKYSKVEVDNKLSALETKIDWKEAVSTYADIATTYPTPIDGWTVNVKDTDYTYRYNGTEWIPISANVIPKATTSVDGLMSKEDKAQVEQNKTDILNVKTDIGDKTTLTTDVKTNLVGAINEHEEHINSLEAKVGTIESQTIVENYLPAHSIPSTAKRGKLDVKLKGLSAVNLPKNGNFANGTTGWTSQGVSGFTAVNGIGEYISTTNGGYAKPSDASAKVGDKVYYCIDLKTTSSSVVLQAYDGVGVVTKAHSGNNTFERLSLIHTQAGTVVDIRVKDNRTNGWDKVYFTNFKAINLTAIDLAIKTALECDYMFPNYFDGLQGASNITVKSTGKNLFDGIWEVGGIDPLTGLNESRPTRMRTGNYIEVENGKTYIFSDTSNYSMVANYYDSNFKFIGYYVGRVLIIPLNCRYVKIRTGTDNELNLNLKSQLEQGTVATAYEPYKRTEVTYKTLDGQPITLHRLPNGVCNEILEDGRNVKRVAEYVLQANDFTSLDTSSILDRVFVPHAKLIGLKNPGILDTNGIKALTNITSPAKGYETIPWTHYFSEMVFVIYLPKGTYANLASAQTALAGTKIIYELAQPQILDTNTIPLVAEPNGHVFITPTASPQPSVELSYPINLGAVVDGLIEGQKEHSEFITYQNTVNLEFDLRITALEP